MNVPSLSFIYREASKTIRRFPFALLASVIAAFSAVYFVDLGYSERQSHEFLYNIILVATLGIAWFTVITLTVEKWGKNNLWLWISRLSGLILLIIYYFSLPENIFDTLDKHGIRYALFFLGVHLLVAIAPFWKKDEINGFWQYNKTLFLRFLTALLFSHVLFLGLVVAMLSIENLFNADLPNQWYSQLWFLIAGIFNTWFFLSGIPDDLTTLETKQEYPKGLKVFTQYILIPLVIIYLVILYLYMAKIIIEWQWPEGWVAILVLSFSIAGIFSLLLLYPIQEKVENQWIKSFSKYYYISLVPLVIMLLLAIWRRISEYGITENRYFVLILGFWLAGIVIYFIFSRSRNIKIIPGSLCIITFLVSFGPWSAFSISENSQINRLESLLSKNKILADGKIQKATEPVPAEDNKEISAVVRYLSDAHGLNGIQAWFDEDLESLATVTVDSVEKNVRAGQPQKVVELMGLEYVNSYDIPVSEIRNYSAKTRERVRLDDYEWLIGNVGFYPNRDTNTVTIGLHEFAFELQPDSLWIGVEDLRNDLAGLKIDLSSKIDSLNQEFRQQNYDIPQAKMSLESENDWIKIRLNLKQVNIQKVPDGWKAQNISTDILIKIK